MNKKELREMLQAEGFPEDSYDLDGRLGDRRYALIKEEGQWSIYHFGDRSLGGEHFYFESEACERLLAIMRSSVRQ